jgi:uncharacterized protein (TIGR00297 family)
MTSSPLDEAPWTKAIPRSRDRLQSRILVCLAIPVLSCFVYRDLSFLFSSGLFNNLFMEMDGYEYGRAILVLAVSMIFALVAWGLRAATPLAATCGGMICLLITMDRPGGANSILHSGLCPLILLFVLTFGATKLGRARKAIAGFAESRKGRNAAQIVANLGIAGLCGSTRVKVMFAESSFSDIGSYQHTGQRFYTFIAVLSLPALAALAEATADTVSSEIGQAFGGQPFLLTTLRRVPPGTDGAITLIGTLAGITGAAIIAAVGAPAMGMSAKECLVAFTAGVAGLFFDSLLGATVERRGWLGNDLVNFVSTAFAAAVALAAIRLFNYALFH